MARSSTTYPRKKNSGETKVRRVARQMCKLESELAAIRRTLDISAAGETIFHAARDRWSAADVVVEADGCGGAKLLIVEGNYPTDYTTHREQLFGTEDEACEAAEQLVGPPIYGNFPATPA